MRFIVIDKLLCTVIKTYGHIWLQVNKKELEWIAPSLRKFTLGSNYLSEKENCEKMRWKWQFVVS